MISALAQRTQVESYAPGPRPLRRYKFHRLDGFTRHPPPRWFHPSQQVRVAEFEGSFVEGVGRRLGGNGGDQRDAFSKDALADE